MIYSSIFIKLFYLHNSSLDIRPLYLDKTFDAFTVINIFRLRFGLANAINNYLRSKKIVLCVKGIFNLKWLLIYWISHIKSEFLYTINQSVSICFWVQNQLLNLCYRVVYSQKLFYSQKAGVEYSYSSFLVYKVICIPESEKERQLSLSQ